MDDTEVRAAIGRAFLDGAAWTWRLNHPRVGDVLVELAGVDEHQDHGQPRCSLCPPVQWEILEDGVPPAGLVDELRAIRAQGDLIRWALAAARRDELVAAAAAAGVTKTQIHRLTGIGRPTIDRILKKAP